MTDDVRKAIAAALKKTATQLIGNQLDGPFSPIVYPSGYYYLIQQDELYYNANALRVIDQLCVQDADGIISLTGSSFSSKYLEILQNVEYKTSTSDAARIKEWRLKLPEQLAAVEAAYESAYKTITQEQIDACDPPRKITYIQNTLFKKYGDDPRKWPEWLAGFTTTYLEWSTTNKNLVSLASLGAGAWDRLNAANKNTANPGAENGGWRTDRSSFGLAYVGLPNQEVITASVKADARALPLSLTLTDKTEIADALGGMPSDRVRDGAVEVPLDLVSIRFLGDVGARPLGNAVGGWLKPAVGGGLGGTEARIGMSIVYPGVTVVPANPREISGNPPTGWYSQAILSEIIRTSGKDLSGLQLREGYDSTVGELFGQGKFFARVKTFVISQEPTIQLTFYGGDSGVIRDRFKTDKLVQLDVARLLSLGASSSGLKVKSTEVIGGNTVVTLAPPQIVGDIPRADQTAHVIGGVVEFPPLTLTSPEVGVITVINKAGFYVRFSVQYSQKGETRIEKKDSFGWPDTRYILLPQDATQIILTIEKITIPEPSVVATKQYAVPVTKSFEVSGPIGEPVVTEV